VGLAAPTRPLDWWSLQGRRLGDTTPGKNDSFFCSTCVLKVAAFFTKNLFICL